MKRALFVLGLLTVGFATPAFAFEIPPNDGFVTDAAGVLSSEEESSLESTLSAYRTETSNEIAIVIVSTLDGEPIEDVSLDLARTWGIGTAENHNGILVLVAHEDRELRIEVGYGLEGAVPDIAAKGIIDTDIVPAFRDGEYGLGLTRAVDSLQRHIGGEYTVERYDAPVDTSGIFSFLFFFVILFSQWLIAVMARTKSWWLGGVLGGIGGIVLTALFTWWLSIPILVVLGLLFDFVISKTYKSSKRSTPWWAGGSWGPGSSRSSSSSFGGFSGGGFGGGGSSGSW